ncbi:MAG: Hsp20/alpha crystallin family protein [Chitinophagaceae bacterium]|nr:Hsp20/alpha crystallin family protein [Chitinophagaceae bacterium]MCA6489136.1 Hsp20/alpha crystallin family protein [Chitinophagaceae bacterium]MCA6500680.1 Hsp20/alpha crystallin family protein [Chitinophagaceae bacterium]MCA6515768.1 Hsp20/alpha crystallin family protein [Chitinophagaceae bacterium]
MSIIKRNPVFPGSLLDEWFFNFPTNWGREEQMLTASPAANITETADAFHIALNVPGRKKEDFQLQVEQGLLTIRYEKKEEKTEKDSKTIRREFTFNSFKRSFTLDEQIDANGIQARYENGLLHIVLPRKEAVQSVTNRIVIQ